MTGIYNVLEKLRSDEALIAKDKKLRYLRPDYQNPQGPKATQEEFVTIKSTKGTKKSPQLPTPNSKLPAGSARLPWPKTLPEQLRAIRAVLANNPQPLTETQLSKHFTRAPKKKLAELMEVLEDLG